MKHPKPKQYDFEYQKQLGLRGEARLDSFFSRWYVIEEVPIELQREGVDRFFIPRWGEVPFPRFVEYKTDFHDSGNAFVETHSVVRTGREIKGWLYTSKADWLVYFMAAYQTAFVLQFSTLRESVVEWQVNQNCKRRDCTNKDYKSSGLVVPLPLILKASHAIFKVEYYFEF